MIIAEVGQQHFGNFKHFKELILVAHESGADLIKSSAFKARDINGSMPTEFYRMCEFTLEQYIEAIEYARSIGNDLFYSIFSPELAPIMKHQLWSKLAGAQVRSGDYTHVAHDTDTGVVSIAKDMVIKAPPFRKANMLYVSDYLAKDPELDNIGKLRAIYGRDIGYSDHTPGIKNCIDALLFHKANIIEKHFTIQKDFKFNGVLYSDCVHAATPKELQALVYEYDLYCVGGLH
jgi:sialic acid synthase SpsE